MRSEDRRAERDEEREQREALPAIGNSPQAMFCVIDDQRNCDRSAPPRATSVPRASASVTLSASTPHRSLRIFCFSRDNCPLLTVDFLLFGRQLPIAPVTSLFF